MSNYMFGIGGEQIDSAKFKGFWSKVYSSSGVHNVPPFSEPDPSNPHSSNTQNYPYSPNYPRAVGRITGYQNPILGDDGIGSIKRGQHVKLDALENVINYMIENYIKDRGWYATVRSREALWNMYRRLAWWVEEQLGEHRGEYVRCLEMIKDCIYKILDPSAELDIDDFIAPSGKSLQLVKDFVPVGEFHTTTNGFVLEASVGSTSRVTRRYNAINRGDIMFLYASDMGIEGTANIKVNGDKVWEVAHSSKGLEDSHRDIRIEITAVGEFEIEFELIAGNDYPCRLEFNDMDWVGVIQEQIDTEVPYCALPYEHRFDADYYNHFDGGMVERPLFDTRDLPIGDGFPDFFRYVSATEDIEWETATDTSSGVSEPIMKIDLEKLQIGNQSKITWNWRFKREGYVEFKYLASMAKGNSVAFFINERHVGGNWTEGTDWETVKFFVNGNQTYKFDLLVRKTRHEKWGNNALMVKDVRMIEVIKSEYTPAPPASDTYGEIIEGKWYMYKDKSAVATYYEGFADGESDQTREVTMSLDNECDGEVSFAYKLGVVQPNPSEVVTWFHIQEFVDRVGRYFSTYGSYVDYIVNSAWVYNGRYFQTKESSIIGYDLHVGDYSQVEMVGEVELEVPQPAIDHYVSTQKDWGIGSATWTRSGINGTRWSVGSSTLSMTSPTVGEGLIETTIDMLHDGFIEFDVSAFMKDGEHLEIYLNGTLFGKVFSWKDKNETLRIPLLKGLNTIGFNVSKESNAIPELYDFSRRFLYDSFFYTYNTPGGNSVELDRQGYLEDSIHVFDDEGEVQRLSATLNPNSTLSYRERIDFLPYVSPDPIQPEPTLVFEEYMNDTSAGYDSSITTQGDWSHVDIFEHFRGNGYGDGILLCEASAGAHRVFVDLTAHGFERGYFEFEYGAVFGASGKLVVKVDGEEIWSTKKDVPVLNNSIIKLELPPYSKELEFVYYA